jgi:hypothetical protein
MMTNLTIAQHGDQFDAGLFDNLKRFDEQGNEYWLARELMATLGYVKWQMFKNVIDIAKENLETVVESTSNHFLLLEVKSLGRNAIDYKLTRLACYHIALACDSRGKDAVKFAKHYFVVKTREAEVIIPAQSDRLRELELINENMKLEIQRMGVISSMNSLHGLPTTLTLLGREGSMIEINKPTVEVIDNRHNQQTTYSGQTCAQLKDWMKTRYGIKFKSGEDVKRVLQEVESKFGVSLIAEIPRTITTAYIPDENSAKAIEYLKDARNWQMLIGEK